MPSFDGSPYSNHPIQIPPDFPKILKQYTKAAIRTQPKDLLLWSVAYFRCLAGGEIPPVKERLEYPVPPTESGLTPGLLRVLNKQLGQTCTSSASDSVSREALRAKWRGICLSMHHLEEILHGAEATSTSVSWPSFLVSAASSLRGGRAVSPSPSGSVASSAVASTMEVVCEARAEFPEGASSTLNSSEFLKLFRLAAAKEGASASSSEKVASHLAQVAREKQGGALSAHNLRSAQCPPLEEEE